MEISSVNIENAYYLAAVFSGMMILAVYFLVLRKSHGN